MFSMFRGVLRARATEALPEARGAAVSAFALALFMGQGAGALAFGTLLAAGSYRQEFLTAAASMLMLMIRSRIGLGRLPHVTPPMAARP
jgi:predicted MFS family arabinose efflux permease